MLFSETKWSSFLARTRALILWPEKLPGLSRNGLQIVSSAHTVGYFVSATHCTKLILFRFMWYVTATKSLSPQQYLWVFHAKELL